MRSALRGATRSVSLPLQHTRTKTFERRVDKNNDVYYVPLKQSERSLGDRNPKTQPTDHAEFFDMPTLLLDLDAEGRDEVRSFDETVDEEAMKAKWAESPKRTAIKATLKDLEAQLQESRLRAEEILTDPTNIWRITWSDITSAALHGAPKGEGKEMLETLRNANGIPPHVRGDDKLFLKWLLLRRKNLDKHLQQHQGNTIQLKKFTKAMDKQTSLTGIRRLAALYFDSVADFQADAAEREFFETTRRVCQRLAQENEASSSETLIFMRNIKERVGKRSKSESALFGEVIASLSAPSGQI